MKKAEILSPAGSLKALKGVINAGCDAVYLAGKGFGARAFAENFTDEELLSAIRLCHLFGKRVYVTVNTLVKESELKELCDFLSLLDTARVDGIIVQDLGVLRLINNNFPHLKIHASTQMSVTGAYAALLLKKYNVTRIVPARELSLDEIKSIKADADIEVEAFIHGAMCYSYSGQCLLSSMLGKRSGNRGRCSQPCRLMYNGVYPLSMRDMYTLNILDRLLEAGIDSLKIEGRMKKPVYAAGVTAIYRKYTDKFYSEGALNIESEDVDILKHLYIRSAVSEGYFYKHNGKDMLTVDAPGYSGADDEVIKKIESRYLSDNPRLDVSMHTILNEGAPAKMLLRYKDKEICVSGALADKAIKAPLSKERIMEQTGKASDTYFRIIENNVSADDNIFIPIGALNELRRNAFSALEDKIINEI